MSKRFLRYGYSSPELEQYILVISDFRPKVGRSNSEQDMDIPVHKFLEWTVSLYFEQFLVFHK